MEVRLVEGKAEPWLLLTDWPVRNRPQAVRLFAMYHQRWAIEDSFKFTKQSLRWEAVRLLNLQGIRTLVALAWVAASFLYQMGVTLDWPEV
ncbi:MAG: transposase [Candidatus Methanomethyliaceae archaeon]